MFLIKGNLHHRIAQFSNRSIQTLFNVDYVGNLYGF